MLCARRRALLSVFLNLANQHSDQASCIVTQVRMTCMGWRDKHGVKLTHTHAFASEAAPSSGAVWKLHCRVSPGYLQHNGARAVSGGPTQAFPGLLQIGRHRACLT